MKIRSLPPFGRACPMAAFIVTVTLGSTAESRAQLSKENNADALNLTSSWVGGVVPGSTDIAQWDSQVTAANTSDLGGPLSWQGIRVLNPAGAVAITGTSPNVLTLGSSGIDMSAATQNLTISSPLVLGSAQTWSVAAGKVLRVSTAGAAAISGTGPLTINGPGQVRLGGTGATYNWTGGIRIGGGNGTSNVSAGGSNANSANTNLFLDMQAISASAALTLSLPALTTNGGAVHALSGSGSGTSAYIPSFSSLNVAAGNTNFTAQRGSGARVIYQFNGTTVRSAGGTVNFRDDIASAGTNNANSGGYRLNNAAVVNGIVPYITYTTTSSNTSWFVPSATGTGLGNNGSAYSAFTSSTANSLGTSVQNSTVVTDVDFTGNPAATTNSIRFNDTLARVVTIDAAGSLAITAGAMMVTNTGTANHTITGGTLMGGAPGSGSANDLIIHQLNNTSVFTINSVIADNVTATALTKSGAGKLVIGGATTYTGATFVNAGTLLVNGTLGGTPSILVNRGGTVGGSGSIAGTATVASGAVIAPGNSAGNLTLGNGLSLAGSYAWELAALSTANPGTDFDLVTVTGGSVDISGAAIQLSLGAFAPSADSFWQTDQTWTGIINNTGAGSLTGTFAAIDNSAWSLLGAFSTTSSDNDVNLVWTAVPEPASAASLGLAGMLMLLVRRRSTRN